jgi:hypothetical protein
MRPLPDPEGVDPRDREFQRREGYRQRHLRLSRTGMGDVTSNRRGALPRRGYDARSAQDHPLRHRPM